VADSPAAQLDLDAEGVRDLLRSERPDLADLSLHRVAEGWDNAIWRLGADLAVRVPRRKLAAPLIRHEQVALPVLGPRLAAVGLRTPIPIHDGRATRAFPWPWSVVPWIDGETALCTDRGHAGRWASDLARALLAVHHPAPPDAPANPFRGVPLLVRDESVRTRLKDPTIIDTQVGSRLGEIWSAGIRARPSDERVWIHGDLHPGNILLEGGLLSALIDFGDVTSGDPAYDLAIGWLAFDARGRASFRAATGDRYDEETWIRAQAWAAAVALILLTQSDDRPELRRVGATTAEELESAEA